MNRLRARYGTRARLVDAEEMIDFLSDEIDAVKRDLEQAIDAVRTDAGDDLANLRDDLRAGAA